MDQSLRAGVGFKDPIECEVCLFACRLGEAQAAGGVLKELPNLTEFGQVEKVGPKGIGEELHDACMVAAAFPILVTVGQVAAEHGQIAGHIGVEAVANESITLVGENLGDFKLRVKVVRAIQFRLIPIDTGEGCLCVGRDLLVADLHVEISN